MKTTILWLFFLSITLCSSTVFAFYPEYSAEDALDHFDFYATYGNKGIEVDKEDRRITIKHRHENNDGSMTYKNFRVEINEVSDTLIEFHLKPERLELLEVDNEFKYYGMQPEIDFEKAYDTFRRGYKAPKHQSHADIRGSHIYQKDTKTKYIKDLESNLITKVEQYKVELTPHGLVFTVKTTIPSEPFEYQYGFESVSRDQLKENLKKTIKESGLSFDEFRALFDDHDDGEKDTKIMKEILDEIADEESNEQSQPEINTHESDDKSVLFIPQILNHHRDGSSPIQTFGINTTKYKSKSKHYDWGDIFGLSSLGFGLLKGDVVRGWGILTSDRHSDLTVVVSEGQINFQISRFCNDWTFEAELFNTLYLRHYGPGGGESIVAHHSASDETEVHWWNTLPFFPRATLHVVSIIIDGAVSENSREDWVHRTRYYSKVILEIDVVNDDMTNAVNDERWGIDEAGELVGEDYRITINP